MTDSRLAFTLLSSLSLAFFLAACGGSAEGNAGDPNKETGTGGESGQSRGTGGASGSQCEPGASFPSPDGCNSCSCTDEGEIACTEKACAPTECDPDNEPHREYYGDPELCAFIDFGCLGGKIGFSNECGCGCETVGPGTECPEWINCGPIVDANSFDSRCFDPAFKEACPDTEIAQ